MQQKILKMKVKEKQHKKVANSQIILLRYKTIVWTKRTLDGVPRRRTLTREGDAGMGVWGKPPLKQNLSWADRSAQLVLIAIDF